MKNWKDPRRKPHRAGEKPLQLEAGQRVDSTAEDDQGGTAGRTGNRGRDNRRQLSF